MSDSVVMTIHDREPEVLMACLRSLARGVLKDAQVIVVNDKSQLQYADWLVGYGRERFAEFRLIETGDYERYELRGYGNPSYAFNLGLADAEGDRVFLMSSDVIVSQKSQIRASKDEVWTCRIVDTDTSAEYCGPTRNFPMPWFLAAPRKALLEIGGWDQGYLKGLCFEDNDLLGRLGLHCGIVLGNPQALITSQPLKKNPESQLRFGASCPWERLAKRITLRQKSTTAIAASHANFISSLLSFLMHSLNRPRNFAGDT